MNTLTWILFTALQEDPARLIEALRAGDVEQREAALLRERDRLEQLPP